MTSPGLGETFAVIRLLIQVLAAIHSQNSTLAEEYRGVIVR